MEIFVQFAAFITVIVGLSFAAYERGHRFEEEPIISAQTLNGDRPQLATLQMLEAPNAATHSFIKTSFRANDKKPVKGPSIN